MLTRLHDLLRLRTSPPIFFGSAAVIVVFVFMTVVFTEPIDTALNAASGWLYTSLGWFYIFGVTFIPVFLLCLAMSRVGGDGWGHDGKRPEDAGPAELAR